MSLLRQDVTTHDWVIFAPERVRRPHDWKKSEHDSEAPAASQEGCPFCPGNESRTGPEIYALRGGSARDTPGWSVRVVANNFPALRIEEDHRRSEQRLLFRAMGGCGAHEVIIESPDHERSLADQPVDQVERLLQTLRFRYIDLLRDRRFQAIVIFKNHGELAGTSLRHPHCQLIATPVVPQLLRIKHQVATEFFDQTGDCLYCRLLLEELQEPDRVVLENAQFAAIVPFASRLPFEVWILPKHHQASFSGVDPQHLGPLAEILQGVLLKLHRGLDNPAYNLTFNTAPRGDENKAYFLWHVQILPRLTTPAGFELGSGMSINTVLPEVAAKFLQNVAI